MGELRVHHQSLVSLARGRRDGGYTLVEMLTTVAVLIIVLGLMVSLARHVRGRAAVTLTKDLMRRLDALMGEYAKRYDYEQRGVAALPRVAAFPPDVTGVPAPATAPGGRGGGGGRSVLQRSVRAAEELDERGLAGAALANNRGFVAALRKETGLSGGAVGTLPLSMYDEVTLRDAWGSPIVFMPSQHPTIGMAPNDRFFFVSAGPDRGFLTQDDNLYSYEDWGLGGK